MNLISQMLFVCNQQNLQNYNNYIKVIQMIGLKIFLFVTIIIQISSLYCYSRCSQTINGTTLICSSPTSCLLRKTAYFSTDSVMMAGYTSLELSLSTALTYANGFRSSQNFTSESCTSTLDGYTYTYLGKLVSTDYIAKTYTVTAAHHRIIVRFSILYVGVWSSNEFLNLYINDGSTGQNKAIRYDCRDVGINHVEAICNRNGNRIDCIRDYEFTFPHNTTYLLVNFTSLSNQRDSSIMFWNIFDLSIFTQNCGATCSACVLDYPNICTACVAGLYMNQNNVCVSTCVLPNQYSISLNTSIGGLCVVSCPQGYYATTLKACLSCVAGCLSCTNATNCFALSSYKETTSFWTQYIILWVILIILGAIFVVGFVYKMYTIAKGAKNKLHQPMSNKSQADEHILEVTKVEQPQLLKNSQHNINDHIHRIDEEDYGNMNLPRRNIRQERDKLRNEKHI